MKKLLLLFVVLGTATQSCFHYNEETINYPLAIRHHADSIVYGLISCEDSVRFSNNMRYEINKFKNLVSKHNGTIVFDTVLFHDVFKNIRVRPGVDSSVYDYTHYNVRYRFDKNGFNTGETLTIHFYHHRQSESFEVAYSRLKRFGYPVEY